MGELTCNGKKTTESLEGGGGEKVIEHNSKKIGIGEPSRETLR